MDTMVIVYLKYFKIRIFVYFKTPFGGRPTFFELREGLACQPAWSLVCKSIIAALDHLTDEYEIVFILKDNKKKSKQYSF